MGLNFAIDELYSTGWAALDSAACEFNVDGRAFPSVARVRNEFAESGHDLAIRHVQLFDCYRAEWRDQSGQPLGGVVGQTEAEAAVFALSRLRKLQRQPQTAHA